MAVFIKRDRLGSRPPPRPDRVGGDRRPGLTQRIEGLAGFKKLQGVLAREKEAQASTLKEKYESNAEVQRWRGMNKEEQTREAIDRSTESIKRMNDSMAGGDTSAEAARKKAEGFAYKSERQKNGE